MAPNKNPIFTLIPVLGIAEISAANTNRDGTGTIVTVITGAVDGTRIDQIYIKAIATSLAGMVRLYIADDAVTPNIVLWKEVPVTAITVSASLPAFEAVVPLLGEMALILPYNYSLRASTEKAELFNIIAKGGVYS